MSSRRRIAATTLLPLVALTLWASPAAAAPIEKQRDRSDNTMYFQYNSVSGKIMSAYSSRLVTRGDRVDFLTYAQERKTAIEGRRLRARIALRLNRDRAVRYDGVFTVLVQDEVGLTVFKGARSVNFALRPQEGERRRGFRWIFDLDTPGYYTIFARFRSD